MWKIALLACALALAATPAAAQPSTWVMPTGEGRPCEASDVIGLWESRVVTAMEAGAAEHYAFLPYDYLRFAEGGGMMYFGTQKRLTDAAQINAELDRLDLIDGSTYRHRAGEGVLMIYRDERPFQGFTCTMVADGGPVVGGQPAMVWTEIRGGPPLRRVQVRVK